VLLARHDSIGKEVGDYGCENPPGLSLSHEVGRSKTSKMDYLRCGGSHALIGIRGPREDTVEVKDDGVLQEHFWFEA
ncbi:Os06g0542000, partial [Oryza sativa Japonica Group]